MPQIDTYTAGTKPVVPDQPLRFMETGQAEGARVFLQAEKLGTNLAEIAGHINEQAANLEWMQNKAARDNFHDQTVLDLQNDAEVINDPSQFIVKYRQRMQDFDATTAANFKHDEAAGHYDFYRKSQGVADDIKVQAAGLKLQINKNQADFIGERERLSDQAAAATTPQEFKANQELFQTLVKTSVENKSLTAKQAEQELVKFERETAEKNMLVTGTRSPEEMRIRLAMGEWPDSMVPADKKAQIMWKINTQEHTLNERKAAQFHQASQTAHYSYLTDAGYGNLPQWMIDEGKNGQNPYVRDPREWTKMEEMNQKKPALTGNDAGSVRAVEMIRTAYGTNPNPSREDDARALLELQGLIQSGTLSEKGLQHARQAVEHFQGQIRLYDAAQRANESQGRARRGEVRAEESKLKSDVTFEQHQYDRKTAIAKKQLIGKFGEMPAQAPGTIGTSMSKMEENKRKFYLNELDIFLQKNPEMNAADAVEIIYGRYKSNDMGSSIRQNPASNLMRPR